MIIIRQTERFCIPPLLGVGYLLTKMIFVLDGAIVQCRFTN